MSLTEGIRRLVGLRVVLVAVAVLMTLVPVSAARADRVVPGALFGQHVSAIAEGAPATLERVGAIRLCGAGEASWREVEYAQDRFDWSVLDAAVRNARKLGAEEILYTLGSTPRWAASVRDSPLALQGAGSNSHPKRNADYLDYLAAVASRYKGQITAYQVWNEANLKDFYLGTPSQLASLTKQARAILRKVDPAAKLVAASTTVRAKGPVGRFGRAYGAAMRAVGWPVDAVSAHFYPPVGAGPDTRVAYIKVMKKYFAKYGAGTKPLWDTEINYGDRRPQMRVHRTITGATAATYVARTYLDAMRYGVTRVFWFGWDWHIMGMDMTDVKSGGLTSGGRAFLELQAWLVGNRWLGCTSSRTGVTVCRLVAPDGTLSSVRYARGARSIVVPPGVNTIHRLDGSSTKVVEGERVTLTRQPVLYT